VSKREVIPDHLRHENIIEIKDAWQQTSRVNEKIRVPQNLNLPVFVIQMELCDYTLYHKLYEVSVSLKVIISLTFFL
jgi:hypothetical protein